jgi:TetR/AcrR family transcriptional repressor of nem operon
MARPSKRNEIIRSGVGTLFRKGYAGAGVRDITAEAGVPLGSFTNHFGSKEEFALEVMARYFAHIDDIIARTLKAPGIPPLQRLAAYLDAITDTLERAEWRYGCLIGNMSLEAADQSEAIRERLVHVFARWKAPFADCFAEAQASGELRPDLKPADLAEFLLAGWHGAILRMKVERSPEPLQQFRRIVDATVFASRAI